MRLDDPFRNRKPEAEARGRPRFVGLVEPIEDVGQVLVLDAAPTVVNLDATAVGSRGDPQSNNTLGRRELDGIV